MNSTDFDNEILINIIYDYEQKIKNKEISAKAIVKEFINYVRTFNKQQWINFISHYINKIQYFNEADQDKIIKDFFIKLKKIVTVTNIQNLINQYELDNTPLRYLVYKNGENAKTLANYTQLGKEYISQLYYVCRRIIDNDEQLFVLLPLAYLFKDGKLAIIY